MGVREQQLQVSKLRYFIFIPYWSSLLEAVHAIYSFQICPQKVYLQSVQMI